MKKIISILMSILMVVTLGTVNIFAENEQLYENKQLYAKRVYPKESGDGFDIAEETIETIKTCIGESQGYLYSFYYGNNQLSNLEISNFSITNKSPENLDLKIKKISNNYFKIYGDKIGSATISIIAGDVNASMQVKVGANIFVNYRNGSNADKGEMHYYDGSTSLLTWLNSVVANDDNYSNPVFSYMGNVIIDENTSYSNLPEGESIQVEYTGFKNPKLYAKQAYGYNQGVLQTSGIQEDIFQQLGSTGYYIFYYGTGSDQDIVVNSNQLSIEDNELISITNNLPQNFPKDQNICSLYFNKKIGNTNINYNDQAVTTASMKATTLYPQVALYTSNTISEDSYVDSIADTTKLSGYYLLCSESNFTVDSIDNVELVSSNNENIDFTYDETNGQISFEKLSKNSSLCISLTLKSESSTMPQQLWISCGQDSHSHGDDSGNEDRNEIKEVYTTDQLLAAIDYFKHYNCGTIVVYPNVGSDKFVIEKEVTIIHEKPDSNHSDDSEDENAIGRDKWLKLILACDIEVSTSNNAVPSNDAALKISRNSKVIIKSSNEKQRKITSAGEFTLENKGYVLAKNIFLENTSTNPEYVALKQYCGEYTNGTQSKIEGPIGVQLVSGEGYSAINSYGSIIGKESYALDIPHVKDKNGNYCDYNVSIRGDFKTESQANVLAYIAGSSNQTRFSISYAPEVENASPVQGQIIQRSGILSIQRELESINDCIVVKPFDDSSIYLNVDGKLISQKGACIKEDLTDLTEKTSKINQLTISELASFTAGTNSNYTVALDSSVNRINNGLNITGGTYNKKFNDSTENQYIDTTYVSWNNIDGGLYSLVDKRNINAEVSNYYELKQAIDNNIKNIFITKDITYNSTPYDYKVSDDETIEVQELQTLVIDYSVKFHLNNHVITGYTFDFEYEQDYSGQTEQVGFEGEFSDEINSKLVAVNGPAIISNSYVVFFNAAIEAANNYNGYLVEVKGTGMFNTHNSAFTGNKGFKLSMSAPAGFERGETDLQIYGAKVETVNNAFDDFSTFIEGQTNHTIFVGSDYNARTDIISQNGIAFNLTNTTVVLHNALVQGTTCIAVNSPTEGDSSYVQLDINNKAHLNATSGPAITFNSLGSIETYLDNTLETAADTLISISNDSSVDITINNGTFKSNKDIVVGYSSDKKPTVKGGRFSSDVSAYNISTGFASITVDTVDNTDIPYAIVRVKDSKTTSSGKEVKPYVYASDDFDIDGDTLGSAVKESDITSDISLIFNAKEETDTTKKSDIINALSQNDTVNSIYDLHIDLKTTNNNVDTFEELHKTDKLQIITIKLTEDEINKLSNGENLVVYHRDESNNNEIKKLPIVSFSEGATNNIECAFLSEDNSTVYIKTKTFCSFGLGTTTDDVVEQPTLVEKPLEPQTKEFDYTGEAQSLAIETSDHYTITGNENVDAGEYDVTITLADNCIWSDETSDPIVYKMKINPINAYVVAPIGKENLVCTGEEQVLIETPATSSLGAVQYSLNNETNYSINLPKAVNAGEYTIYYKTPSDKNHKCVTGNITVTISKGEGKVVAPTAIENLKYNGQEQVLINAGSSTTGTIKYSLNGTDYSIELPKASTVGSHTVYYLVEGNDNFKEVATNSIEVEINKGTSTVTAPTPKQNVIYNGNPQELINAGSATGGTIKYSLDDINYSAEIPTEIDADQYTVYYLVEGNDNYEGIEKNSVIATISKATPTITEPTAKTGLVYKNDGLELINSGSTEDGEIQYSLDNINYSESIPTGKDAKEYTVYYKVIGDDNHTDISAKSIKVTIAKAKVDIPSADTTTYTYNGQDQTYGIESNDYYTVSNNIRKNAGKQNVSIVLKDTNNYEWNGSLGTYEFVINKAKVSKPQAPALSTFEYDGQPHSLDIAEDSDHYQITGNTLTSKGTTKVAVSLLDKDNYCWSDNTVDDIKFDLTITGKIITIPAANLNNFVYTGSQLKYFNDTPVDYQYINNEQTNAGSYKVKVQLTDKINTTWSNGTSDDLEYTFDIAKKKVKHPSINSTEFIYDGNEQTYNLAESELYVVSNNKKTNAGTYTVNVELKDTNNYEWEDEQVYTFIIKKKKVNIPEAAVTIEFTYDGTEKTYQLVDSADYQITGNKATNAGSYVATVSLKDASNTMWSDSTIESKTYAYTINKADPQYTLPNNVVLVKTHKLSEFVLPDGWAWEADETIDGLKDRFNAIFTPSDTDNYNKVTKEIVVSIIENISTNNNNVKVKGESVISLNNNIEEIKSATTYEGLNADQLSAIKTATNVAIEISVENVNKETPEVKEDIKNIEKNSPATKLIDYLDIDLDIVADGAHYGLTNTSAPITFTVDINTSYLNVPANILRTFYVLRNHNGIVDKLPAFVDGTGKLSFASNLFSVYAIGYEDVDTSPYYDDPETYVVPNTGV